MVNLLQRLHLLHHLASFNGFAAGETKRTEAPIEVGPAVELTVGACKTLLVHLLRTIETLQTLAVII